MSACAQTEREQPASGRPAGESESGDLRLHGHAVLRHIRQHLEIPVLAGQQRGRAGINAEILAARMSGSQISPNLTRAYQQPGDGLSHGRTLYQLCARDRHRRLGNDGDVYTWTYDTRERKRVTWKTPFPGGVTEEQLRSDVRAELAAKSPYSFTLNSFD